MKHAHIDTGRLIKKGVGRYDWQQKQRIYEFGSWAERNYSVVNLSCVLNWDFVAA